MGLTRNENFQHSILAQTIALQLHLESSFRQSPPHKTPLFLVLPLPDLPIEHLSRLPVKRSIRKKTLKQHGIPTRIPALVAALTASISLSYVGSQDMVNAESRIRPFTCTPK